MLGFVATVLQQICGDMVRVRGMARVIELGFAATVMKDV